MAADDLLFSIPKFHKTSHNASMPTSASHLWSNSTNLRRFREQKRQSHVELHGFSACGTLLLTYFKITHAVCTRNSHPGPCKTEIGCLWYNKIISMPLGVKYSLLISGAWQTREYPAGSAAENSLCREPLATCYEVSAP